MDTSHCQERKTLIHLIRGGLGVTRAAQMLGRSRAWGYKWWGRFQRQGWEALRDRPRTPRRQPRRLPDQVYQAIRQVRSELEAEAQQPDQLDYIGAFAIRARLQALKVSPLPSISSIERELRRAGLVKPRHKAVPVAVDYPHLCPTRPQQVNQADILPRHLSGGVAVACFNAIDVVSRYPSGRQYATRSADHACQFLCAVWQEQGIPDYQQVDNDSCFSGGTRHPGVLGKVVRLALLVGTQLVFTPFYHPESNGLVERFHQEYARFVWQKGTLADLSAVHQRSALFLQHYRTSRHHRQLQGRSPTECHTVRSGRQMPAGFSLPQRLPVTAGQVHFIRAVDEHRQVKVLNLKWAVPRAQPRQGVWVTLTLTPQGASLAIFDAAPDAPRRTCLAQYPFPLKEKVVPLAKTFWPKRPHQRGWADLASQLLTHCLHRLSTMF